MFDHNAIKAFDQSVLMEGCDDADEIALLYFLFVLLCYHLVNTNQINFYEKLTLCLQNRKYFCILKLNLKSLKNRIFNALATLMIEIKIF